MDCTSEGICLAGSSAMSLSGHITDESIIGVHATRHVNHKLFESKPVWIILRIWRCSCDHFEIDLMLNKTQRSALLPMVWAVFRHLSKCIALIPMLAAVICIIWVTNHHVVSNYHYWINLSIWAFFRTINWAVFIKLLSDC